MYTRTCNGVWVSVQFRLRENKREKSETISDIKHGKPNFLDYWSCNKSTVFIKIVICVFVLEKLREEYLFWGWIESSSIFLCLTHESNNISRKSDLPSDGLNSE